MNRRALLSLVVFAASTTMGGAWAELPCQDDPTQNTLQINECRFAEFKITDGKLNQVYRQVLNELAERAKDDDTSASAARQELITAQRAWLQFRDGECGALYTYYENGTIRNMAALQCKIDLTNERIATLGRWLDHLAQ